MSDRYAGKPFLRLLDSYVLNAIGELDEANAEWLKVSEPNFAHQYGGSGTWQQIVEQRMQFRPGMRAAIVESWESGRAKFRKGTGEEPHPVKFAHMFVDRHFPS
ncbi:MAG: hypothetical protein WBA68_03925 [Alteraurantiacibacter sp.]